MDTLEETIAHLQKGEKDIQAIGAIEHLLWGLDSLLIHCDDDSNNLRARNIFKSYSLVLKKRCDMIFSNQQAFDKYTKKALWNAYIFLMEYEVFCSTNDQTDMIRKLYSAENLGEVDNKLTDEIFNEYIYVTPLFGNTSFQEQGISRDDFRKKS